MERAGEALILLALALTLATGKTVVLTYHDMVPKRDSHALWFDCTPDELRTQIAEMRKRGVHFISVQQLYNHLASGAALPPKPVAITFADNYEGFYRWALPILRAEQIPVAMFVHTDYVGDQHGRPKMSWQQLLQIQKLKIVTIASQTCSHPADLRKLTDAQLRHEFVDSKRSLETHLGKIQEFVAYPNGKYDARVANAAKAAGYRMAFTESLHPAENAPNLFMVPRYVHTKYRTALQDAGD